MRWKLFLKKRNKLAPEKVEDLIIIKENKSRIQAFKTKNTYELKSVKKILPLSMFLWLTLLPIWMKTQNLMMKPLIMTKETVKYFSMSMMMTQTLRRRRRRRWRKSLISYTIKKNVFIYKLFVVLWPFFPLKHKKIRKKIFEYLRSFERIFEYI